MIRLDMTKPAIRDIISKKTTSYGCKTMDLTRYELFFLESASHPYILRVLKKSGEYQRFTGTDIDGVFVQAILVIEDLGQ